MLVDWGLSMAIWPIIRGCYWILNIIGGTSRYRRKAMKLSYRWLSYCGSTCLHWSFNRAVNAQWTPMNLDQNNVPDDPLLFPRYVRHPALAVWRFAYTKTFINSSVIFLRKDSKIKKKMRALVPMSDRSRKLLTLTVPISVFLGGAIEPQCLALWLRSFIMESYTLVNARVRSVHAAHMTQTLSNMRIVSMLYRYAQRRLYMRTT